MNELIEKLRAKIARITKTDPISLGRKLALLQQLAELEAQE